MSSFKQIPEFPDYCINQYGAILSNKRNTSKILKPGIDRDGYEGVILCNGAIKKSLRVHRLVMAVFVGESNLQVNHKDFNKRNNHISNLEYVTQSENMQWNIINGVSHVGELSKTSKLDWSKVLTIYTLGNFRTNKSLSNYANVSVHAIEWVRQGKAWKHLFECSPPVVRKRISTHAKQGWVSSKRKLSDSDMEDALEMIKAGITQSVIAKKFNVNISTFEYRLRKLRQGIL